MKVLRALGLIPWAFLSNGMVADVKFINGSLVETECCVELKIENLHIVKVETYCCKS